MALEILVPNAAIRNLIREDKVHQIYSMMQTGQDKYGMQTFNQALATLYHKRLISAETALQRSSNVDELKELMERGAGLNTGNRRQRQSPESLCPGPPDRLTAHHHRIESRTQRSSSMPTYVFKGRNKLNETVVGERVADNRDALRQILRREQVTSPP